jgi:hypothetical protein
MDTGAGIAWGSGIVGGVSGVVAIFYKVADMWYLKRNNGNGKTKYNHALCEQSHDIIDGRLETIEECKENMKKDAEQERKNLAEKVEQERKNLAEKVEQERKELDIKSDHMREIIFKEVRENRTSIEGKLDSTRSELVGLLTEIGRKIDSHIQFHAEK